MGEPILVTMDTLHDVFTFSPFTTDDVVNGDVRADVGILLRADNQTHYNYDVFYQLHMVVMHGMKLPVCLWPATAGNQFLSLRRKLVKGTSFQPMAVRQIAVCALEPGMIVLNPYRACLTMPHATLSGVVVGIELGGTCRVTCRTVLDACWAEEGEGDWFLNSEAMVSVLVVEDDWLLK